MIDWTAYRGDFEREASAYIGRPVAIAGKANVRLLPTPVVSFTDIRIGDAATPDVEMERFHAEIELAPLLRGEVRVIQMNMERPRFRVDLGSLAAGEGAGTGKGWRVGAEQISLARLEIVDGAARIADSRAGRSWQAEDIDAVLEAVSLVGPAKVEADLTLDGKPLSLRAALGRYEGDPVAATATMASPLYPVTLALDGAISLTEGAPPAFAGTATIAGIEPEPEGSVRSPWADFRATGIVDLTPAALAVEGAQISYGGTERPLVLEGSGRLDFGDEPRFDLTIHARQIDVDRNLGGGAEDPVAVEEAFTALLEQFSELPASPLPGRLHLGAQGIVIGGGIIEEASMEVATMPAGWRVEGLRATLPGDTSLQLAGTLRTEGGLAFTGHGRVASRRPPALAAWWRGRVGSAAELEQFAIEADLEFGADNQRLSDIVASTGEGITQGSVELKQFQRADQLFVEVDLSADRADLTEARALTELLIGKPVTAGQIDHMAIKLRAGVLSVRGIEARSVEVDGELRGRELTGEAAHLGLRRLSVGDLAGTKVEADVSIRDLFGSPSGNLNATLSAADISGAAAFLAGLFPANRAAGHLREVAPLISPVEVQVAAEASAAEGPLSINLTGSFAETHLSFEAKGEGSLRDPESLTATASMQVDAANGAEVLAQFGIETLPLDAGPLRVGAEFDGAVADAGRLNLEATFAGVTLDYAGETARRDGEVYVSGDMHAESENIDPALLLAGFAVPGVGEGHSASANGRLEFGAGNLDLFLSEASFDGRPFTGSIRAEGDEPFRLSGSLELESLSLPLLFAFGAGSVPAFEGAWSDAAFAAAVLPGLALDFQLAAKTLDLGFGPTASNAALQFALGAGALNIDLASAEFVGGTLKGTVAGAIADGQVGIEMRGSLQGGQLQALVWERNGLPIASGIIDGAFDVAGSGRSMAGLVSTLAGTGSFAISDGRINALNPEALGAVMEAAADEGQADEDQARETFAIQFGSGALSFGRAAGSLAVAAGVARVPTVSISAQNTTVLAEATVDLNTMTLNSDWTVRATEAGSAEEAQPHVEISFFGPVSRPERRVNLTPLLDLVRNNLLQRQLDEIEELEEARRQAEARRLRLESQAPAPAAPPRQDTPAPAAPPPRASPPDEGAPLDLLRPQDATAPLARPELLAPL